MDQLIQLLIYVVVFAIIAAGLYFICKKFELPQIVLWICGAFLLIIILVFVAHELGSGAPIIPRTH